MTTALGVCAAVLAVAAAVQAIRMGIRHGDWMPLSIAVGLIVALALVYLGLVTLVAPHVQ